MKGLVLYGVKCDVSIWDNIKDDFNDLAFIDYPYDILNKAKSIDDLVKWLIDKCNSEKYDILIGHSMAGQIILKTLPSLKKIPNKIVLIESSPVPSGMFYRNLLTKTNEKLYGNKVREMLQTNAKYYTEELLKSIRDDFDYTSYIRLSVSEIYAVFGDRGVPVDTIHYEQLNLPLDIIEKMKIFFINNSCHMPMIENPQELIDVLKQIINE